MAEKSSIGRQVITIILIIALLAVGVFSFGLDTGIRDWFADTVSGDETIPVTSIEYVEIIEYVNSTIWNNATEYIPLWINTTEYLPLWYNNTIWINDTIWINTTEYIEIPIIEYLPYPFEAGWNVSGTIKYCKAFESGSNQYKMEFYNQLTGVITSTTYTTLVNIKSQMASQLTSGAMSQQQYDCLMVQLFILSWS